MLQPSSQATMDKLETLALTRGTINKTARSDAQMKDRAGSSARILAKAPRQGLVERKEGSVEDLKDCDGIIRAYVLEKRKY